jgi:hypothetical protein
MPNFCAVRCALSEEVEAAPVMTDNRHSCGVWRQQQATDSAPLDFRY